MELNKILQGDVLEQLKNIPNESINCCMTSPPYWALRDYGVEGQLGLEPTFQEYINKLCDIFDEVKRVLRKDGTLWVNIGDTYNAGGNYRGKELDENCKEVYRRKDFEGCKNDKDAQGIEAKSLCNIPARFSIEMQNRGWILRNVIIWHKPNCMPSSVKDRFTIDFEYLFFFVKNKKYFFETQYEPSKYEDRDSYKGKIIGDGFRNELPNRSAEEFAEKNCPDFRNKRAVWTINSKYKNCNQEAEVRQGMHKERGEGLVEKRYLPKQKEFVDKIRDIFTAEQIAEKTGLPLTKIEHWFRYDGSGFSYPSKDDWEKLDNDLFPELKEVWYKTDDIETSEKGRIKRTTWTITTKPFREARFATYPEELCETPIRAGCPEFVCNKCGKPKEKILKRKGTGIDYSNNGNYDREIPVDNPSTKFNRNSNLKLNAEYEFKGYSDCGCNEGFSGGVCLDPFFGAGTTGLVALKQNKKFIGIELNPEYIKIAEKRLKPYLEQTKFKGGKKI